MSTTERFLGSEEVSQQLGMSPEWVRRQVQAGRLRARVFLIGGRPTYRFAQTAVDEFLARYSRQVPGDGTPVDFEMIEDG
ncbi:MAG: helix-turn-helix domain-containing protein [Candidatus Limnocylindrales bacterium]